MRLESDTFHYPPELFNLLVETIPKLNRSKDDVLTFFEGAGVDPQLFQDLRKQVRKDRDSIYKYEIAKSILRKINKDTDKYLRERREILKRVVEFDSFETCWEDDRREAKGLVEEVRKIVDKKDSFTRMKKERKREMRRNIQKKSQEKEELRKHKERIQNLRTELSELLTADNPQKRGKQFEDVMNRIFDEFDILVKDAFTISGDSGEGVIEEIDGVVKISGNHYLVEMKWWEETIGRSDISNHLVKVHNRGHARAIIISASGYSQAAISIAKDYLEDTVIVLIELEEIIRWLEKEKNLKEMLIRKIDLAVTERKPFKKIV